jgi:hypothetical protein
MKLIKLGDYNLEVKAISPLLQQSIETKYRKENPEPKVPTYTVEAAGGIVETFEHNETTVDTAEEKAEYKKWKDAHDVWSAGLVQRIVRMFLLRGLNLKLTSEQVEELEIETDLLGFTVPTNERERNLFWLETFIVDSQEKLETVMQEVLGQTGIKQEALSEAESLF